MHIANSLHWSLIVICHPGEVAGFEGIFLLNWTMSFGKSTLRWCIFIFQMKTWTSHPKCHAYCIWILSKEVMQVSKILSKGILKPLQFIYPISWICIHASIPCYFSMLLLFWKDFSMLLLMHGWACKWQVLKNIF